jgi:hypothetical protein
VNGRWTGILRSVAVRDPEGHAYDAAAIEIEKGPRLPYPDAPEAAAQSTALLVRRDHTIWDAAKFPIGNRVELTGSMMATTPLANHTGVWRDKDGVPDSTSLVIITDGRSTNAE